jgi:hypothetical protein
MDLTEIIKNCNKYHYLILNNDNSYKHIASNNKKVSLPLKKNQRVMLIKLKTITKSLYEKEKKSPFKITGGPIYAQINTYINNSKLVKEKAKFKNKIYFPKKYIKKMFKNINKDINTIFNAYINNNINQGLMAINKITDY